MNKPEVTSDKYSKSIKISLVLCWIGLIVCCLIKLFGGNFFSINVEDGRFIQVCNYIDNNMILLVGTQFLSYLFIAYLCFCLPMNKIRLSKKQTIILLISAIIIFIFKFISMIVAPILEVFVFVVIPIIINKTKWYKSIIYFVIYNAFCLISVFTKSIGNLQLPDNSLTGIIFMLDVYFMMILSVIYNYKKEMKDNG